MHSPHLELAKKIWADFLRPGDLVIDATCGQGRDTLFLCQLGCIVYGFDIQEDAIEKTKKLLSENHFSDKAHLFHASHAEFPPLPSPPKLIVYNLGYLPGGNKGVTTLQETTLQSVAAALDLTKGKGAVSITCYPGHPEGEKEEKALLEMASHLPSHDWLISHHRWPNRLKAPSLLFLKAY